MTALVVSTETGAESMGGRGSRGSGGQHQWICNPRIDNMSEKKTYFSQWKVLIMGAGIFNVTIWTVPVTLLTLDLFIGKIAIHPHRVLEVYISVCPLKRVLV